MPALNWPTTAAGAPAALSELTPAQRTRAFEIQKLRVAAGLPSGSGATPDAIATQAWLILLLRNAAERARWTVANSPKAAS